MDFDAYKKEVDTLQATYNNLKVLVPKLEEEVKGLKETISDLHQEIVNSEVVVENNQQALKEARDLHDTTINAERLELAQARQDFDTYKTSHRIEIEKSEAELKEWALTLTSKQTELANLLQKQVEAEKLLETEMASYAEKLGILTGERATINSIWTEIKEARKDTAEEITALELARMVTDKEKAEAAEMIRESEAKLTQANISLKEVRERDNLLSLKIDEYDRKEVLLGVERKRLQQKEVALNDRASIYESHSK
jgi:chromosome segregation ATPase